MIYYYRIYGFIMICCNILNWKKKENFMIIRCCSNGKVMSDDDGYNL